MPNSEISLLEMVINILKVIWKTVLVRLKPNKTSVDCLYVGKIRNEKMGDNQTYWSTLGVGIGGRSPSVSEIPTACERHLR